MGRGSASRKGQRRYPSSIHTAILPSDALLGPASPYCPSPSPPAALAGCGSGGTLPTGPIPIPPGSTFTGAAFSGTVLAGTTPLSGATVQLFAAGATGNGAGATPLLSSTLTTDSSGNFNVAAGYTCATASAQLSLIARGGALPPQAPATTSTPNPAIVLMAPVGACSGITTGAHLSVNELTTATSAWALSPFLALDGTAGASSTNTLGLADAFTTALNLQSAATVSAPPAAYTAAVLRLHSLANLLHTCVALAPATACSTLFAATTAGITPTDTARRRPQPRPQPRPERRRPLHAVQHQLRLHPRPPSRTGRLDPLSDVHRRRHERPLRRRRRLHRQRLGR